MLEEAEMARTTRTAVSLALVTAGLALAPTAALADGLPIPGVQVKPSGVATPNGRVHFQTRAKRDNTTVLKINWATDKTVASATVPGRYTIPAVALDGTPGGLSADGRRLTLIKPRVAFPQARTQLVSLDTDSLRVLRGLDLPGDYSFDAISPTGNRIYLIQYLSRKDPTRYAVREYNTATGRMLSKPIVDPTEPDEQMRGLPLTRVASPDGRWQYTLYSGSDKPFVHALDTAGASARCIDLPGWAGDVYSGRLRMSPDGTTLALEKDRKGTWNRVANIDTRTFRVSPPSSGGPSTPAASATDRFPWLLVGLGAALALAVAVLWGMPRVRRRRFAAGS
jgi:hypothetical protein